MPKIVENPMECRINLRITDAMDKRLRENAAAKRMTLSDYIKELILIGLKEKGE